MSEKFRYVVRMEFNTETQVSADDLLELGQELVNSADSFMHSKRMHSQVTGIVDIMEGTVG